MLTLLTLLTDFIVNMFTGIIQTLGKIEKIERAADSSVFFVSAPNNFFSNLNPGASVALNGVCLTVENINGGNARVTAVQQTLLTTALNDLKKGEPVNLELPCTPQSFLGGHIVMGHVDGVAEVSDIKSLEAGKEVWFFMPPEFQKYIISKGSIALDGVSMTVAEKTNAGIKVAVIPETLVKTRFGIYQIGTKVNFEVDLIGKYIENLILNK